MRGVQVSWGEIGCRCLGERSAAGVLGGEISYRCVWGERSAAGVFGGRDQLQVF